MNKNAPPPPATKGNILSRITGTGHISEDPGDLPSPFHPASGADSGQVQSDPHPPVIRVRIERPRLPFLSDKGGKQDAIPVGWAVDALTLLADQRGDLIEFEIV